MESVHLLDSFEFRIFQKNIVENEIKPILKQHPNYKVLYFGTATIPLALHLGYCFGSWKDVDIYLLNREKMTWNWAGGINESLPAITDFIKEEFTGPIEVIYKVEATYNVQEDELKQVVQNPSKIIRLSLADIGKDVFQNQHQLKTFAHQFSLGLDSIAIFCQLLTKFIFFPQCRLAWHF